MPRGKRHASRRLAAAAFLLLTASAPAWGDIFRWVDDEGTIHFTDDLSSVPQALRGKVRPLAGPAPVVVEAPPAAPSGPAPGAAPPPAEPAAPAGNREDLVVQAEQLRAKISAKEQHIRYVDEKQSLATNPLRNRIVDPADMELYRKYQSELPGDREQLADLEARIASFK